MLRVGHQNVYHLYNKVPDLCVFLSQPTPNYNNCISRKGSLAIGQTCIAVYIHNSIADITHRCQDLESDLVECIWLELKPSTSAPNIFVCILYRNPSASYEWLDNFVKMMLLNPMLIFWY